MSILIRGMDMPEENERIRIEICGDGRVLWTHQFRNKTINNPNKWLGIRFYAEQCQELGRPQDVNVLIRKIVGTIIEVGQSDGKFKLGEIIRYTPAEILRILTEHEDQIFGKEPSAEQQQDEPNWQQVEIDNNSTEVNKKNDELINREDALNFRVSRGLQEDRIIYVPMKEVKDYLRGLPSAQPDVPDTNVGDMISRQAAMEICRRMVWNGTDDYLPMSANAIENEIRQLPPVKVCETAPNKRGR